MELMIPLPLILPDIPLALDQLEEAVHDWGLVIQQAALARAWQVQAALRPCVPCPDCHSDRQQRAGSRIRTVETCCGPVRLRRARVRCQGCGRHFQPDDTMLDATLGAGRCTPLLRAMAAQCGASWPYRQAAQVIGMLRGTPLAVETIRRIVAQMGGRMAAQYDREATAASQPPATAPPPSDPPAQVAVVLDGSWVRSWDNAQGMEIKVGVVHTGSERCGATRTRLTDRRYAATTAAVTAFGGHVTAAIDHVDGFAAGEQTLLGDGAAWIWRLGADLLPMARHVLDRWHLRDARRRATRAAIPDKAIRQPWSIRLEEALDVGSVEQALKVLNEMMQRHPHPALAEFAGYLGNHAARIPDYAARQAAGQTIGSGAVEKGVDIVVNRRLKGRRGMRWWRKGAAGVIALRLAILNEEWDQRVCAAHAA
jgi:hypothetical protein